MDDWRAVADCAFLILSSGYMPGRGLVPRPVVVDVIELNTIYDGDDERFQQYIFWKWSPDYCRLMCQGWVLSRDASHRIAGRLDGVAS